MNNKKRRTNGPATSPSIVSASVTSSSFNEDELYEKLGSHFTLLRDIRENERLRKELDKTTLSLQLYEQYKKQKQRSKPKKKAIA